MGDCNVKISNKKRVRDSDELVHDSPELKRVHSVALTDHVSSGSGHAASVFEPNSSESGTVEPEAELESSSSEARMIQYDLLAILEDTETDSGIQDLDLVIRSFEEEIRQGSPTAAQRTVVNLTSDSGESQPELGYLLEASDDELGLPPTGASSDVLPQYHQYEISNGSSQGNADDDLIELSNVSRGFEDDLQIYDAFDLDMVEKTIEGGNHTGGDYVTVDGLFDYAEPSDFSEFGWQPESLPAL